MRKLLLVGARSRRRRHLPEARQGRGAAPVARPSRTRRRHPGRRTTTPRARSPTRPRRCRRPSRRSRRRIDEAAEEAAAAAEAANIGGTVSDYAGPTDMPATEAERPLAEAGEGEAEGQEQAELDLEHAAEPTAPGMSDAEHQIDGTIEQAANPLAGEQVEAPALTSRGGAPPAPRPTSRRRRARADDVRRGRRRPREHAPAEPPPSRPPPTSPAAEERPTTTTTAARTGGPGPAARSTRRSAHAAPVAAARPRLDGRFGAASGATRRSRRCTPIGRRTRLAGSEDRRRHRHIGHNRADEMSTLVGMQLSGRYRLDAQIGAGGMSTVYRAFDQTLERQVAIKLMHREIASDSDQLERFRREARAVAQLSHPHIVGVIDAGEDEGRPYIVFEYVEGETLKERIRRMGRLPVDEAIAYAIEIARALGCAHSHHIVHRDVKPQNVLIDGEGSAKVTDFGIARTLDQEGLTADGRVLGTTDYVSPEQALGHDVNGQSDIYSLGVVLYEMLVGDVPVPRREPGRRRHEARARGHAGPAVAPPRGVGHARRRSWTA